MRVGQKVEVVCPSKTAYGDRAIGPIPANSDLIFIIERTKWCLLIKFILNQYLK